LKHCNLDLTIASERKYCDRWRSVARLMLTGGRNRTESHRKRTRESKSQLTLSDLWASFSTPVGKADMWFAGSRAQHHIAGVEVWFWRCDTTA
jgi:hypothetical protein